MQTSTSISFVIAVVATAPLALAQSENPQEPRKPALPGVTVQPVPAPAADRALTAEEVARVQAKVNEIAVRKGAFLDLPELTKALKSKDPKWSVVRGALLSDMEGVKQTWQNIRTNRDRPRLAKQYHWRGTPSPQTVVAAGGAIACTRENDIPTGGVWRRLNDEVKPLLGMNAGVAPPQIAITPTTPTTPSVPAKPAPSAPAKPAPVAVPATSLVNLSPEQISAAKKATGILVHSAGSGTAFCISESGIFVTCDHVVDGAKADSLAIVIDPTGKNEKRYPAKVIRRLAGEDLAVLKVELDQKVPPLKLGDVSALLEGQPIFAFGYPFGKMLAVDAKSHPAITVNFGRITSLRNKGGVLDAIQLDGQLNPGNSGGPALNEKGEVVGIVVAALRGSGINFAIPVSHLQTLLTKPEISVEAPAFVFEKRFEPAEFKISVDWMQPQAAEPKVSIEISSEGMTRNAVATKGADGKYRVSLAPLVKKPAPATNKLGITVDFEKGQMTGTVEDFDLAVNGERRPLSKITSIVRAAGSGTFTVDGKPAGALPELARLNIDTGAVVVTVDARKATRIKIVAPTEALATFSYKAVVTNAAGSVFQSEARDVILAPAGGESSQPQLHATTQLTHTREFPLPSPLHDAVAGEGGRVLVLHYAEIRKLAVFDVVDLKVRGYINLTAEPALIAAGLKHILVVYPDENIMRRYSIETLQADRTISNPFPEKLTTLVMGYSSPRIAMAYSTKSGLKAFDAETMAVTGSSSDQTRQTSDYPMVIRASADGRTYGCTRRGTSSGFNIVTFTNGQLSLGNQHGSVPGILVPNSDGSLIFTDAGIYTPNFVEVLKRTGSTSEAFSFFPSYHPMYFFGVPPAERSSYSSKKERPRTVAIYLRGSGQPLVYLPEAFEEMSEKEGRSQYSNWNEPLTMDKRYHFYPQLNLFLTIPPTNDRIVARPVNVRQVLTEKGIDYLYVTSSAPAARAGAVYHYHLEAASKAGGIKFAHQSGPAGLTVSADGNVAWTVPAKAAEESVIVSVMDASGQEILHTFHIAIAN